jgi:UDP-N-acetylmuramoyl-L-alanyl-D-glutamate--2,6-diaminopimelate ligase
VTDKNDTATTWLMRSATGESCELLAPIIGNHMVANATLAAVMLMRGGVSATELEAVVGVGTHGVPVVIPGRVERVSSPGGPQVFVDAGRSADAYHHTLSTIRELTPGRLVMVCGTSGNRDHTKRPIMGRTAATLADVVIVTDDDPRNEDPRVIREGLLEGARAVAHAIVHDIPDPTEAIGFAISLVGVGDSVLWSGPGSQAYRDIAGKKIPYSARDEARRALDAAGWTKKSEEL